MVTTTLAHENIVDDDDDDDDDITWMLRKIGLLEYVEHFYNQEIYDVDTMFLLMPSDLKNLELNEEQQSTFRYKIIGLEYHEKIIDLANFKKKYPLDYKQLLLDLDTMFGFQHRLCIHNMTGHDCHFTDQARPAQDDEEVMCLCPCCKEEADAWSC
jgi:hypothetical protein